MPRRATPLDPDDGPQARFALALRLLRDRAGFDAKTIESIAAENYIPKSTLYAAMRGTRMPTRPVLAALVRAWNGDPEEWLVRRTETEAEIERLRQQSQPLADRLQGDEAPKEARDRPLRREVRELRREAMEYRARLLTDDQAREDLQRLRAALSESEGVREQRLKELFEEFSQRRQSPKFELPWELPPKGASSHGLTEDPVALLLEREDAALQELDVLEVPPRRWAALSGLNRDNRDDKSPDPRWNRLRVAAGQPTYRTMSERAGVRQVTISEVMRGYRNNSEAADRVWRALKELAQGVDRSRREPPPADD
ncbi:hypothetical protein ABZY05_46815 [Streptomyces canus]|uniref:hypothetical protein n=1 Tax=Streptomyces canus TaxID=58343 RepID=UPI0033A0DC29